MGAPLFILHLGLGAFHRAHQACYLQALHDLGDRQWHLASGNIRPAFPDPARLLAAQDNAYTLETVGAGGERRYQQITAMTRPLPYDPDLAAMRALGAHATTRIISFTVTEAGYFLDAEGRLNHGQPDLQADLAALRAGRAGSTIYGALCAILRDRMARAGGAVTLLCCDNLRHNGTRFRRGLLQFADMLGDRALASWIAAHTSCPNAMVDRITPRPPAALAERVRQATGRIDAVPVMSERYLQWVIEDDFCNGRPDWRRVGVELVASVAPYEEAKIRILNASHSCIAWAGVLAGYRVIHECMRDARIRAFAHAYVTDAVFDCLLPSPIDLAHYRDQVFERFASDAIEDSAERVLADGAAKLAGFIVPTIAERLARGRSIDSVAVLPALFLLFLQRWHSGALRVDYHDQALDPALVQAICSAPDPVDAFCQSRAIWDTLAGNTRLLDAMHAASIRVRAFAAAASMRAA
jgi:D-arabinitol 4-dehydrogenase